MPWDVLGLALLILLGVLVYVLPALIAGVRGHPQAVRIALLNVALGWTVVGWGVCFVMAVRWRG